MIEKTNFKKNYLNHLFLSGKSILISLFICTLVPSALLAQEITINTLTSRTEVSVGDTLPVKINLCWPGDGKEYFLKSIALPDCRLLSIIKSAQKTETTISTQKTETHYIINLTLKAEKQGQGRLGDLKVSYKKNNANKEILIKSTPLNITIVPAAKKPLKPYSIYAVSLLF